MPTPGHNRPSRRTQTQPGTDVRDPPVQTGPVAGTFTKMPTFFWDDRHGETLDSGMGTLQSRGIGPVLESLLPDARII